MDNLWLFLIIIAAILLCIALVGYVYSYTMDGPKLWIFVILFISVLFAIISLLLHSRGKKEKCKPKVGPYHQIIHGCEK